MRLFLPLRQSVSVALKQHPQQSQCADAQNGSLYRSLDFDYRTLPNDEFIQRNGLLLYETELYQTKYKVYWSLYAKQAKNVLNRGEFHITF